MFKHKIYNHSLNSINDIRIVTERLDVCLDKLARGITGNSSIISNIQLGTLAVHASGENIGLFELCERMHAEGFKLASLVPTGQNVLADFKVKSSNLDSEITGKPTHSIYFSHLELIHEGNGEVKKAPGWFIWLNQPENGMLERKEQYSRSNILFAKVNPIKIYEVSQIEKKTINQRMEVPDYANLPEMYDGVHNSMNKQKDREIWGCETTAIWNTRCISEMKCFQGIGRFQYSSMPLFDIKTINIFDLCRNMKRQRYEYVAFIPTDMSKTKNGLVHDFRTTSPELRSELNGKPTNSIFFTKLESIMNSDGSENHLHSALFDWLHKVHSTNDKLIVDFSKFNIVFASINMFKIYERNDPKIPLTVMLLDLINSATAATNPINRDHAAVHEFVRVPDYHRIGLLPKAKAGETAEVFAGIQVNPSKNPEYEADWGVETVAVWNFNCIENMKYFQNTGQWSYAIKPLFRGDPTNPDE